MGQLKSIDKAYAQVNSKYIFKVEDDYVFHGNKNFLKEAVDVLECVPHVHHVWLTHMNMVKQLFDKSVTLEYNINIE